MIIWYYNPYDRNGHLNIHCKFKIPGHFFTKRHDDINSVFYNKCPVCWLEDEPHQSETHSNSPTKGDVSKPAQ